MTARSNGRWNPITNAYSARMMDPEVHTVAEFDMLPGIYGIRLQDAPYSGQPVTISGYTEVPSGSPASGQFRVDYVNNSGLVIFHSSANAASVTVNYYGVGSVITQELLDTIGGSGSGQGAKSYVLNGFFETDVDTDTEESDAAVSITEDTSTPLAGTRSANLAWASHAIGDYVGFDLSDIDEVDQGTRFRLRFYKRDGGTFVQGDLEVVYAYTIGSVETEVNFTFGEFGEELPEGDGYVVAYAEIPDPSGTLGQIRFKALDNAHDFDIDVDEITFGPISQNSVNAIGDWQPFDMTISASSGAPTKATTRTEAAYRRYVGDSVEITYVYYHTSATGAADGTGTYLFQLPDGRTADTSKVAVSTSELAATQVGSGRVSDGTVASGYAVKAWLYNSTSIALIVTGAGSTSAGQTIGSSAFAMTGATRAYHFTVRVPIVGRSSNLVTAEDAAIEYLYNTSTANSSDTTSFGYGKAGGLVPSVASADKDYTVQASRNLTGASISLEFNIAGNGVWLPVEQTRAAPEYVAAFFGARLIHSSTTQLKVRFHFNGTASDGVAAAITWANEAAAGTRYRVKVVYNPAAVEVPDVEITAWQAYTPTTQGLGAISNVEFAWRRVRQSYEVMGRLTTGTVNASEVQIGLPNSATVGTQITASGIFVVGEVARGSGTGKPGVLATPGDTYVNLSYHGTSPYGLGPRPGNTVVSSYEDLAFLFSVPIAGLT